MKQRCFNPKDNGYKNYGARGISVFSDWIDNFESYELYIMSLDYAMKYGYTVDRIDTNKNYEPGNLRWASCSVQNSNKRKVSSKRKYIGVRKMGKKHQASLKSNCKNINLGVFDNEIDAAIARNNYIIANSLPNTLNII